MFADSWKFKPVLNQLKYISLWGMLLCCLSGCEPPQISVDRIAQKKTGKVVYLRGKVIHLAPFVDNAAYQLEDNTGAVWVVTADSPPQLGEKLTVKGKIEYQSLSFEGKELGDFYLVEMEKLPIDNSSTNQN